MKSKSFKLGLLVLFLCVSTSYAWNNFVKEPVVTATYDIATSANTYIEIENESTVYTRSFNLVGYEGFSVDYQVVDNDGAITLKIELEQGLEPPTTEGSADASWTIPTVSDMTGIQIETALTTKTKYSKPFTPIYKPYGRWKITGNSGNITCSIEMYNSKLERR